MNRRKEDGQKAGRRIEGRRTDREKFGEWREGWKMNRRQEDGQKAGRRIEGRRTDREKPGEWREGWKMNRRQEDGQKAAWRQNRTAFVFFESSFTSVSTFSRGHPSPVSLAGELRES
jgi:hypothetical protein